MTKERETSGVTTMTRKGQVTIPLAVRNALGLKAGDMVEIRLERDGAGLVPVKSVTERTAGVFKTKRKPPTAEQLRRMAEEAIAEDVIRRMGG